MRTTMKALFGRSLWTPRYQSKIIQQTRSFAEFKNVKLVKDRRNTNRIFVTIASITVAGGAYLLRDDIRHAYFAAVRSGRVAKTLFVNINE